jgi:hypothetical protein
VTMAERGPDSWHYYGLAADIVSKKHGWNPPITFWRALARWTQKTGLTWGNDWNDNGVWVPRDPAEFLSDAPHVQWGGLTKIPMERAASVRALGGNQAVWRLVGATNQKAPARSAGLELAYNHFYNHFDYGSNGTVYNMMPRPARSITCTAFIPGNAAHCSASTLLRTPPSYISALNTCCHTSSSRPP